MVSISGLIGWNPFIKKFLMSKSNPQHYRQGSIEPWDFIVSQNLNFLEGNIIKYVTRAGKKDGESRLDDLTKAAPISANLLKPHHKMKAPHPDPMGQAIKFRNLMEQPIGIQSRYSEDSAEIDLGGVRGSYGGTC